MIKLSRSFELFIRLCTIFLLIGTLSRLCFVLFNLEYAQSPFLNVFFYGLRFDVVSMSYGLLPVFIALLLPFNHSDRSFLKFTHWYASVVIVIFNLLNFIDVIYFRFTLKRTTWDIFSYISTGDDVSRLIPQFLMDYWYMVIIFVIVSLLSVLLIRRKVQVGSKNTHNIKARLTYGLIMLFLLFVFLRGGLQLRPLNIIDASRYSQAQNASFTLNTPFTMMKSMTKSQLEVQRYFRDEVAKDLFDPRFVVQGDQSVEPKNVVVIILESFSREYIGFYNEGNGYTPFLDSLMAHSTVFNRAFANGKRSIEALPAIFAGLPNLMTEAYSTSPYAGNKISTLPLELKKHGYFSAFYHGGHNGTMGFNSFSALAGFDDYKGMDEYPSDGDYDGAWGIFDEPYFQYFAEEQGKMKEPFLSAIFSLSAHHPYHLPEQYNEVCTGGELKIHPMICYSDQALRKYFDRIKDEDWFSRTLFVLTADHTAQSAKAEYSTTMGVYAIPIILFDPSDQLGIQIDRITQQCDITPTILAKLNLESSGIYFGKDALSDEEGFALSFHNSYQFIEDKFCIQHNGKEILAVYDHENDPLMKSNLKKNNSEELKQANDKFLAIVQQYNQRLIQNDLTIDD